MDSLLWIALVTIVLLFDLALGVAIGWRLGKNVGERSEAEVSRARLDRTFRSLVDLMEAARDVSNQTGNYIAVTKQIGAELAQLPPGGYSGKIAGLLESQRSMQADLEEGQARLSQNVETSQMALSPQRRQRDARAGGWHIELLESLVRRGSRGKRGAADPTQKLSESQPPRQPGAASEEAETGPRREPREPYRRPQRVAPYVDGRIPPPESFQEVECLDISRNGIAFLVNERPATEMIVITTGDEPSLVYRSARIVHVLEMKEGGATRFRVGCEFIGRLSRHLF